MKYSPTPLNGHLIFTDSLLCSQGKKALTFSLSSTRLTDTPLVRALPMVPSVSVLTGFYCTEVEGLSFKVLCVQQ